MSRRDTIIIAVLLNAALLVVLFLTAVQNDEATSVAMTRPLEQVSKQESVVKQETIPVQPVDTIDDVLNKYSEVLAQKQVETKKEPPKPQTTSKKEPTLPALPHEKPYKELTVVKGDVLEKIARNHGVSVDAIMKENDLHSSALRIGQKLRIPKANKSNVAKPKPKSSAKYYVVKGGDNPWTIARKNNMQVEELLKLNNMDEAKAKRLRPGDKLRIE